MLKIGDKVRMTKRGFRFYSNLDYAFRTGSVGFHMSEENFISCVCELFAIHGVGVVKKIDEYGVAYVKWTCRLDGVKYFYTHYYETKDLKKINLLDKIIFKIQGRI